MNVEITRGRSDIYDILTWLSFSFTKLEISLLDEAGEVSRLDEIRASRISNKELPLIEKKKQFLMRLIFRTNFWGGLNIYDAFGSEAARPILRYLLVRN
jgi:hypothetical protein